jgi:replicative DNA helicase
MPIITLQDAFTTTFAEVAERTAQGGSNLIGYSTGIHKLDEATGGLRNGAVMVLAGRVGMGKSSLAQNISEHVSKNYNVFYLSLEMDARLLALRMMSAMTRIPALDIEYGRLDQEQLEKVRSTEEIIRKWKFKIGDDSVSRKHLYGIVEAVHAVEPIDLLTVDQISIIHDNEGESQTVKVANVVKEITKITRDMRMATIEVAQLNRNVEHREDNLPTLSDLKDTGRIEEDAHVVIFVYRPQYYLALKGQASYGRTDLGDIVEDDAKIIIAKNRQGPSGAQMSMFFYPERMKWDNPPIGDDEPPPSLGEEKMSLKRQKVTA